MFIAYQLRACPGAAVCSATCALDTYCYTEKKTVVSFIHYYCDLKAVLLFFFELVAKLVVNLRALKLFFLHLTSIKEVIGN